MNSIETKRVAVIGAGPSGLVTVKIQLDSIQVRTFHVGSFADAVIDVGKGKRKSDLQ